MTLQYWISKSAKKVPTQVTIDTMLKVRHSLTINVDDTS